MKNDKNFWKKKKKFQKPKLLKDFAVLPPFFQT